MSGTRSARRLSAAPALLLIAGVAISWSGWLGLRSYGPVVALAGAGALRLWLAGRLRRGRELGLAAGCVATGLIAVRLGPAGDALDALRSTESLIAVTAGCAVLVALSASWLRRPPSAGLGAIDRRALSSAVRGVAASRLLVFAGGALAVAVFGVEVSSRPPSAVPFAEPWDTLLAPATAWDADSYLTIAQQGYAFQDRLQAFSPLYPALVRFLAGSPELAVLSGIAVSIGAFTAALYLLHRLVELEFDADLGSRSVALLAFAPMSLFFSAIYTEALFLALSVAMFYAARRRRWGLAVAACALATATRPTGVLLLVPLAIMLWRAAPRSRLGLLVLAPAGMVAYLLLSAVHGDALAPFRAQEEFWGRTFVPLDGLVRGLRDSAYSLEELVRPAAERLFLPTPAEAGQLADPRNLAIANLTDFAFLVLGVVATAGVLRRLPLEYGAYCLATIAVTTSTSFRYEPLASVPRFLVVLFPCYVWAALKAREHDRQRALLVAGAVLLAVFAARFATWHWVA